MNPWQKLELERTSDVAAIRRAYARKLKAIDVDTCPQAFIELREALTLALGEARSSSGANEGAVGLEPASALDSAFAPEAISVSDAAATIETRRIDTGPAGDIDDRVTALAAMLFADEGSVAIDPARFEAVVREILHHPDMVQIDRSLRVEHQLAELLCRSVPRSDPIIPAVVDHFGWSDREGEWDLPWQIGELVGRCNASALVAAISDPRHRLHKAYLDLVSDKAKLGFKTAARTSEVKQLLITIRQTSPAAEAQLAPHRVALWEARLNRKAARDFGLESLLQWGFVACLVLSAFVRFFTWGDAPPPSLPREATFTSSVTPSTSGARESTGPDAYLEPIVRNVTVELLGIGDLARRNPPLYDRLVARWREARDRGEQNATLEADIRALLVEAIRSALRGGTFAVQSTYWRFVADQLIWLQQKDVVSCAASIDGRVVSLALPQSLIEARNKVSVLAISEAVPNPPPPLAFGAQFRFNVPGALFEAAARRAQMSPAELTAALNTPVAPDQRCKAWIALIEAALALPEQEAAPFLREMSAGL